MTELAKSIQEAEKSAIVYATDLLTHYSFELGDRTVGQLTQHWLKDFSAGWIRLAVIEALYQGRYKAVSVDQILLLWKRRSQPCYHFNYEFERLVCNKFPRDLSQRSGSVLAIALDPSHREEVLSLASADPANLEAEVAGSIEPAADLISKQPAAAVEASELSLMAAIVEIEESQPPIHQFTPPSPNGSDFHSKLKAVAESGSEEPV